MPTRQELRATQGFVAHMTFCWRHPSLTALEVAWRWLFGVPFLLILWGKAQQILLRIPADSAGLGRLSYQNPWLSAEILYAAAGIYRPAVVEVLRWLVPAGAVVWALVSGIGRTLVLARLNWLRVDPSPRRFLARAPGMIALQFVWAVALTGVFWLWYRAVAWDAATHLDADAVGGEADLIGFLIWLIFISLAVYSAWAMVSWVLSIAPVLMLHTGVPVGAALAGSFRLGREFSGKLVEINLVMSIVKIALIVLAMVFCSAPLPFSDQLGPGSLGTLYRLIAVAYLIANDYFHVVRLKSFFELWRFYRGR